MSLTSIFLKTVFGIHDKRRNNRLIAPLNVERFTDISYGDNEKYNVLDVYKPKEIKGKLPVIISVHGGGWIYGDKEGYSHYCLDLARRGFAVVNFSYRLAPKFKFPLQLHDVDAVFSWTKENAEKFGFDMKNAFAVGDSAGANMLTIYFTLFGDKAYAEKLGFKEPKGFIPKAVALNCGVYKLDEMAHYKGLMSNLMKDYLPNKGRGNEIELASPYYHVNKNYPPCFMMTCEGDFAFEQTPPMVEKLKSIGVPVTYKYYGDKEHPLGHVFHLAVKGEYAEKCNDDECEFFKQLVISNE